MRGLGGHADLLRVFRAGGPAEMAVAAAMLDYGGVAAEPPGEPAPVAPEPGEAEPVGGQAGPAVFVQRPRAPVPLWRLVGCEFLGPRPPEPDRCAPVALDLGTRPAPTELRSWNALVPRLRGAFTEKAEGRSPDIEVMIHRLGKGRMLDRLPRLRRRRWGSGI